MSRYPKIPNPKRAEFKRALDAFNERFSDFSEDRTLGPIWNTMLVDVLRAYHAAEEADNISETCVNCGCQELDREGNK